MQLLKSAYTRTGAGLASVLLFKASTAQAAGDAFDPNSSRININGSTDLNGSGDAEQTFTNFASKALNIILLVVGVLAVFYLIYSGFLYITSAGNQDKVKQARQGIINAIIGIVIILAAFFIVRFATGLGNTVTSVES